jgi:hypothetical protein
MAYDCYTGIGNFTHKSGSVVKQFVVMTLKYLMKRK